MTALVSKHDIDDTEQLEALKKALEEYMYAVSHDFATPLRHTREFTKLLLARLGEKIGPEEKRYVSVIDQSLRRSEEMLQGLLQFSRLDTRAEPFVEADCAALANEAWKALARQAANSGARVHLSVLPKVYGDAVQIKQLFYHLFDNAIKFRRRNVAPDIHVAALRQKNEWRFHVRDNGMGIDPELQQQVFMLFKRAHGQEDLPGVGVGLALCRKILQHHGGRIWCESAGDGGMIFVFTLPAAIAAH